MEVYVDSPLGVCIRRDPKGIYRRGLEGTAVAVPGLQIEYEAPENPDLVVHGDKENPERAAERVIQSLVERGYVK
jgi:adenylylsulfate kinase-like enzyme